MIRSIFIAFALVLGLFLLQVSFLSAESASVRSNSERSAVERVERNSVRNSESAGIVTVSRVNRAEHRTDEIIVRFKGSDRFVRVSNARGEDIDTLLARYNNRPDVIYAEPNYIAHAFFVPNDRYYSYQWNFDNNVSGGIHMEDAWEISDGSGIIIAVIDTGVAYENYSQGFSDYYLAPDLASTLFVQGYDFVNNDTHPNDDEGHGTHVTGTIAQSTNNNAGVAGIAYGASIMPIKVLGSSGSGSYADIADGVRYAADNGAHIINLSLGGPVTTTYLEEALAYAYGKGVIIVAAAGNNGTNSIAYPAAHDEYVIAVGATRFDETRAPYSDYGSSLDIMAPGGDTTVDQNGDGYGDGILQQTFGRITSRFGYYFYSGTSMASPHVAAVAALVMSHGNATTPLDVREALESTAKDLGAPGRDNLHGYGLLDAVASLAWNGGAPIEPPPPPEQVDDPPTISITSPENGSMISGSVTISVTALDDEGVASVDFYADGALVSSDTTFPYEALWNSTGVSDDWHLLSAMVTDNAAQTASFSISVLVENINEPPVITSTPSESGAEGALYSYDVDADDFDVGDILVYFLTVSPAGMTIDSITGMVEWTPTTSQEGVNAVEVKVMDSGNLSDSQAYSINVIGIPEDPPQPPPPPPPADEIIVFEDSFENGLSNWVQDAQNDWERKSQRATDGRYSAELDGRAIDASITSPLITLAGKTNATVTFSWYIERRLDKGEYIAFEISTDGGGSWSEFARLRGNVDQEDSWHHEEFTLNTVNDLMLRFKGTISKRSEDADVDSVKVLAF